MAFLGERAFERESDSVFCKQGVDLVLDIRAFIGYADVLTDQLPHFASEFIGQMSFGNQVSALQLREHVRVNFVGFEFGGGNGFDFQRVGCSNAYALGFQRIIRGNAGGAGFQDAFAVLCGGAEFVQTDWRVGVTFFLDFLAFVVYETGLYEFFVRVQTDVQHLKPPRIQLRGGIST